MALIVAKFGGKSVGRPDHPHYPALAEKMGQELRKGHQVVVVPSAMDGETARLIGIYRNRTGQNPTRDLDLYDALIATGEQVSGAKFAQALRDASYRANFLDPRDTVQTDGNHGMAAIKKIDAAAIRKELQQNGVVVAGAFYGRGPKGKITTGGRGASDTWAVEYGIAMKADRVDIYTDTGGLYTADPKIVGADVVKKIDRLQHDLAFALASAGGKFHPPAIKRAMDARRAIQVLSSFEPFIGSDLPGTLITPNTKPGKEGVIAVAKRQVTMLQFQLAKAETASAEADLMEGFRKANIHVDPIEDSTSLWPAKDKTTRIAMAADAQKDWGLVAGAARQFLDKPQFQARKDLDVHIVSLVGYNVDSQAATKKTIMRVLRSLDVEPLGWVRQKHSLGVLVANEEHAAEAMRRLHQACGLHK